mmetsp:Transcript_43765/g.115020  ORF Transcript_43765/g.115020 Transcript_43765/m.115020 type:complete len:255 (-) Transcript_43765:248-1012(-)
MEALSNAKKCAKSFWEVLSKDPPRTLRWSSAISGVLLIIGGISGVFTINPLAAVISVYNVFFGLLIVLTELKSYPIIRTFQKRVDTYFHLLSVPRGKGGFYCFIGFLAFFAEEGYFSLTKLCVMIVTIVGLIHLFSCKRCGANEEDSFVAADSARQTHEMQGIVEAGEAGGAADDSSTWASLMKQVVTDSPEIVGMGLQVASNPNVHSVATSVMSGSSASAANGSMGGSMGGGVSGSMGGGDPDVPSCNRSSTL